MTKLLVLWEITKEIDEILRVQRMLKIQEI